MRDRGQIYSSRCPGEEGPGFLRDSVNEKKEYSSVCRLLSEETCEEPDKGKQERKYILNCCYNNNVHSNAACKEKNQG